MAFDVFLPPNRQSEGGCFEVLTVSGLEFVFRWRRLAGIHKLYRQTR